MEIVKIEECVKMKVMSIALVFMAYIQSNACSLAITDHENTLVMQTQQPPFSIGTKESIATNEHAFSAKCRKVADAIHPGRTFTLSIVTTSIQWGLVWRADYVELSEHNNLTFDWRMVCWISPEHSENEQLTVLTKIIEEGDSPLTSQLQVRDSK